MKNALLLFCLVDLVFLALFAFSIIYDFGAHILLIFIAFVACITYYPLVVLFNETKDGSFAKTKMWLAGHVQFCTFYCVSRGVFLLIYFSTMIIEGADLDISYVYAHLHTEVKVILGILAGLFVILVILNFGFIVPYFKNELAQELSKTTVYASIYNDGRVTQKKIFNTLEDTIQGANRVYLTPADRSHPSADLTTVVTQSVRSNNQ